MAAATIRSCVSPPAPWRGAAVADTEAAYARVCAFGIEPITREGPQQLPPSTGSVRAFKFRDPDGHPLELLSFPPGSGDPRWQHANDHAITLGIDHSAISVADVGRSIAFYTLLGMSVPARQINHGIEQQELDALADVRVDVVALQPDAAHTPHVELLGYLDPRGRASPVHDVQAIAADRLVLKAHELEALRKIGVEVIASSSRSALLRDPDGHLLVLE